MIKVVLSWPRLLIGMLVTGAMSLSVHVVMLQILEAPYPSTPVDAPVAQFVSRGLLQVLALIWLNALMRPALTRPTSVRPALGARSLLTRSAVLFVLTAMLTEQLFRMAFMQGYCTNSMLFAFIGVVPQLLALFVLAGLVVATESLSTTPLRATVIAAGLAGAFLYGVRPGLGAAFAGVLKSLEFLSHPEWCVLPYGWNVEVPAYLTFAEPVVAAFAIAALVWDRLASGTGRRVLLFALLVLMLRRQLIAAPIYMVWSDLPPWRGLAAMGQFSLEALALGVLTGVFWPWAQRRPSVDP